MFKNSPPKLGFISHVTHWSGWNITLGCHHLSDGKVKIFSFSVSNADTNKSFLFWWVTLKHVHFLVLLFVPKTAKYSSLLFIAWTHTCSKAHLTKPWVTLGRWKRASSTAPLCGQESALTWGEDRRGLGMPVQRIWERLCVAGRIRWSFGGPQSPAESRRSHNAESMLQTQMSNFFPSLHA